MRGMRAEMMVHLLAWITEEKASRALLNMKTPHWMRTLPWETLTLKQKHLRSRCDH